MLEADNINVIPFQALNLKIIWKSYENRTKSYENLVKIVRKLSVQQIGACGSVTATWQCQKQCT